MSVSELRDSAAVAVALLTLAGAAIRILVAHQPLFADELSTYWIVTAHGPRGVLSTVHSNAEITPPLFFLAAWVTTQAGHAPELVRLPSLVAGVLTIPVVYLVGLRTIGRAAALAAAAIVTFAPFTIYYSTEARSYGLLMLLLMVSTLALLLAGDGGDRRWWWLYAAASCAAVYTHYLCVFPLGAQLLWLLWAHPEARRPALLANAAAVVGFLPWITGLVNDFNSPTSKILSALSPFDAHSIVVALGHWALGYPYTWAGSLAAMPGVPALVLLGAAVALAAFGIARGARRIDRIDRRLVLVLALALSVPVGEALVSAVGTNVLGVRNLAPGWPPFALALAAFLAAAGPQLRVLALSLAVASFAIGAVKMLSDRYERPDYRAAADYVDRSARPGDVVIDEAAVLTPGPLSPMDVTFNRRHLVFRGKAPQERDHPFGFRDPIVPLPTAVKGAVAAARGNRVFVVSSRFRGRVAGLEKRTGPVDLRFPARYRLVASRSYPGILVTRVDVFAP